MPKECVAELTRNYTASEFVRVMSDISRLTDDVTPRDYAILVESLVEKDYGYDVAMNVLIKDHSIVDVFDDDFIRRCIAFVKSRVAQ